jgi:hypothetical protein
VIALNIGPDEKDLGIEILYAREVLRGFVMATRQIVIEAPEKTSAAAL